MLDAAQTELNTAHGHPGTRVYRHVFAALMALLLLTLVAAWIDLGRWNFAIAASIATVKAVLILLFFMHVRYSSPLTWLIAAAGFFWLAILFGLTFNDYLTRSMGPHAAEGRMHGEP